MSIVHDRAERMIAARNEVIADLRISNKRLRRVIVLLCLLGLGLIAYGFLHNAFLSAATALAVGSSWGDFIA